MSLDTQRTGQIGVNVVERIVLKELGARWQPIDAHNDDGTDGLIFLEDRKGNATGQIVFVQVKCWEKRPSGGLVSLSVTKSDIENRIERWAKVAGAAILIWVNPKNLKAYWVDLKDLKNYSKNCVVVKISNEFNFKSLNKLRKLSGTLGIDSALPIIVCSREDISFFSPTKSLKFSAKEKYRTIRTLNCLDRRIGEVNFGRVGWKHITRKKRPVSRVTQSLQLICVAKRIVETVSTAEYLRKIGGTEAPAEIFGLTARVIFPHRDAAVIRVILLRQLPGPKTSVPKTWFYSVYERRRKLGIRGENTG